MAGDLANMHLVHFIRYYLEMYVEHFIFDFYIFSYIKSDVVKKYLSENNQDDVSLFNSNGRAFPDGRSYILYGGIALNGL